MARVKGGPKGARRRKAFLSRTKGFRFARSKKKRAAKEALLHAGYHAFKDRRAKKRTMRGLHIIKVNAAVRAAGIKNYSTFINSLKKKGVMLDRKVLSQLAEKYPEVFARLVKEVS